MILWKIVETILELVFHEMKEYEMLPRVQFHLHNSAVLFITKAHWVKRVARLQINLVKLFFQNMNFSNHFDCQLSSQKFIIDLASWSRNPRMFPVLDHLHHWKYFCHSTMRFPVTKSNFVWCCLTDARQNWCLSPRVLLVCLAQSSASLLADLVSLNNKRYCQLCVWDLYFWSMLSIGYESKKVGTSHIR